MNAKKKFNLLEAQIQPHQVKQCPDLWASFQEYGRQFVNTQSESIFNILKTIRDMIFDATLDLKVDVPEKKGMSSILEKVQNNFNPKNDTNEFDDALYALCSEIKPAEPVLNNTVKQSRLNMDMKINEYMGSPETKIAIYKQYKSDFEKHMEYFFSKEEIKKHPEKYKLLEFYYLSQKYWYNSLHKKKDLQISLYSLKSSEIKYMIKTDQKINDDLKNNIIDILNKTDIFIKILLNDRSNKIIPTLSKYLKNIQKNKKKFSNLFNNILNAGTNYKVPHWIREKKPTQKHKYALFLTFELLAMNQYKGHTAIDNVFPEIK